MVTVLETIHIDISSNIIQTNKIHSTLTKLDKTTDYHVKILQVAENSSIILYITHVHTSYIIINHIMLKLSNYLSN